MKLKYFLFLLPAFFLAACNSSSDPGEGQLVCIDVVTLESNSTAGSIFSLQPYDDLPKVTLISTQQLEPKSFKEGTRIVIQYIPQSNQQYTSGNISILGASTTLGEGNPAEEADADETNNWLSDKVNLGSVWRSGKYLNIRFSAESSGNPRDCRLYFDTTTLGDEYPVAYLVYFGQLGSMTQSYTFFASYDIAEVWNKDNVRGIDVNVPAKFATSDYITTRIEKLKISDQI